MGAVAYLNRRTVTALAFVIRHPAIGNPFPGVAYHIVKTPGVRLFHAHRRGVEKFVVAGEAGTTCVLGA